MKKRIFISSAALAAMTLCGTVAMAQDNVFKIGLILPMTGQQASTGRQVEADVDPRVDGTAGRHQHRRGRAEVGCRRTLTDARIDDAGRRGGRGSQGTGAVRGEILRGQVEARGGRSSDAAADDHSGQPHGRELSETTLHANDHRIRSAQHRNRPSQ